MQEDNNGPGLRAQRCRWRQNRYRTLMEWLFAASEEQREAMVDLMVEEELGRKRN